MRKLTLVVFLFSFLLFHGVKYTSASSFSLAPSKNTYRLNETFTTDVILSTAGGRVSAADIYFTFDKDKLRLEEIVKGKIFDQYIGQEIDNFLGKAAISGIVNSPERLFKGTGTFVSLRFKTLKTGTASVVFKFTSGSKNDSNVADFDQRTDTLTEVENGLFIISSEGGESGDKIQSLEGSGVTPSTLESSLEGSVAEDNTGQAEKVDEAVNKGEIGTGVGDENSTRNTFLNRLPSLTRRSLPVVLIGILGVSLLGIGIFIFNRSQSSRY